MEQLQLQSQELTPELRGRLEAMYRQVVDLGQTVVEPKGRSKADRHERRMEQQRRQFEERDRLRTEIDRLVPRAPFPVADNGAHEYVETPKYLLFRNHGEIHWQVLLKKGGGYSVLGVEKQSKQRDRFFVVTCDMDPSVMLQHAEAATA